MKITMEGKWARKGKPTEQVRILCIDRSDEFPVVFLTDLGTIVACRGDGSRDEDPGWSLVPLEEPLIVRWEIITKDGDYWGNYASKELALETVAYKDGGRIVKLQEVRE